MNVRPDDYLDARQPQWADAELLGGVHFNPETRLVEINDARTEICLSVLRTARLTGVQS